MSERNKTRLPSRRKNRIVRDITWRQPAFLGCLVAVGLVWALRFHNLLPLLLWPVGVVGAIGYANGPGYTYPLLWWRRIWNFIRRGKAYGGAGSRTVFGLEPTDFGQFGTNWIEETDTDIVYADLGGWAYANADPDERYDGNMRFVEGLRDILSQSSDRQKFGFMIGSRPQDVEDWRASVKQNLLHPDFVTPDGAMTSEQALDQYDSDLKFIEKLFSVPDDQVDALVDGVNLEQLRGRDLDAVFDELSDEGTAFYNLVFIQVKRPDEWKGINRRHPERFTSANFASSMLMRVSKELTSAMQSAGFENARILSYDEVCELDYKMWNVHTPFEAELAGLPKSPKQRLNKKGLQLVWPFGRIDTRNNQLITEGGRHAFLTTTRFGSDYVDPGEMDRLTTTGLAWHFVTLTAKEASLTLDRFALRRSSGEQGGLFGGIFNQTSPDEIEYQEAEARRLDSIDALFVSQLGVRFTRRDMLSSTMSDDLEQNLVPTLEAIHRSQKLKTVRESSASLITELDRMLGV